MKCDEVRAILSQSLDNIEPYEDVKGHLDTCPECAGYYQHLRILHKGLKVNVPAPLDSVEFAAFQQKLDKRIEHFQNRTVNFYRHAVRYGATVAAVLLLVIVSVYGPSHVRNAGPAQSGIDSSLTALSSDNLSREIAQVLGAYSTDTSSVSDTSAVMDENYLQVIIGNYVQAYGFNAGDMLLGNPSAEELQYLQSKIKAGDIL